MSAAESRAGSEAPPFIELSGRRPASWVILDLASGQAVLETFDAEKVSGLNAAKYEAVPIQDYLMGLNASIRAHSQMHGLLRLVTTGRTVGLACAPGGNETCLH
ncbi:hypothetical protein [Ottowia sp.]|uniref:hypothetical protein n=1 Tax=Ottowia sp. TaxID=1898956 RepID=UPI0025DA64A7|nr:hypothetical protein [Ottowia sp.]MBK6616598.1 hypothetical protein [Ottowia sp.]